MWQAWQGMRSPLPGREGREEGGVFLLAGQPVPLAGLPPPPVRESEGGQVRKGRKEEGMPPCMVLMGHGSVTPVGWGGEVL